MVPQVGRWPEAPVSAVIPALQLGAGSACIAVCCLGCEGHAETPMGMGTGLDTAVGWGELLSVCVSYLLSLLAPNCRNQLWCSLLPVNL